MITKSDNLPGLSYHVGLYTGVISNCHQQWVSKGSVYLNITIIGRVILIWDEVFCKIRVYFDGMVTRKEVLSDFSHRIETHLDVVVEVIGIHISLPFEFCLDEYFIEFWWADLMFQSPHATNFGRVSTVQWWKPLFIRDHGGRVRSIICILLCWWVCQSIKLIWEYCKRFFEFYCELRHFLIRVLLVGSNILFVGFNCGLNDDELFIILVLHIVGSSWHLEAWCMNRSITEIDQWLWFGYIWRRWALMIK